MNPYSPPSKEDDSQIGVETLFELRTARIHIRYAIIMTLGYGLFWGTWLSVSICHLLQCLRFKVTANSRWLSRTGVLGSKQFRPESITRIQWRTFTRWGSVRMFDQVHRSDIDFSMLDHSDRMLLVTWLRDHISHDSQHGWPKFEQKIVKTEWPKNQTIYDLI